MLGILQNQEFETRNTSWNKCCWMEEIEELSANICLMAIIQTANNTSDAGPSYDYAFISKVQSSSINENKEQMYPTHTKIINSIISDDQIDSNIIFDEPNGHVNSGNVEKDTHVPDLYALEQLARNANLEEMVRVLENINRDNNYLNEFLEADRKAKHFIQQAQSQFIRDRDIIRDLEKQRDKLDLAVNDYKQKNEELQKTHLILKQQMSENKDCYHDNILDLEAKLKKNVDLMLKLGNFLQGIFMLGPKPLSLYDPQLKHGLGYSNPYTLKQATSQCPKLYLTFSLSNSEIPLNVRDTEDTLDDASKKVSVEQKYFPSSFIPSHKTSNATSSIPASIPSKSPLIIQLDKMKNCFQTLSELIQKNCKRASIFYTSPEEIQLNDFCQDQVKPIVNELQFYFEFFRKLFQRDIKEMKDDFESTESELCEIEKQNDVLKDQLLEASLKHEVEIRMNVAYSVKRPMNRDSHVKNSVLANSKNSAKKVAVYVGKNKQTDNTSANVISNKDNVNDANVANAAKAITLLCVSCMQNVLIPYHDDCLEKYKLNVHSNVRRDLSTNSRTPRSSNTTNVVLKTRFSDEK
ncbi:hypothetical protein Tco_0935089 [Tanacetum coccineum]